MRKTYKKDKKWFGIAAALVIATSMGMPTMAEGITGDEYSGLEDGFSGADYEKTIELYRQDMYDIACNYKDGTNGYEKNEEEAVKYYKLVAEDGSAKDSLGKNACFYLGWIMSKNETEKDDAEAVSWYEKAIEKGVISAITGLGWNYGNGIGVTQDYEKAIELYRQAADSENSTAMNNLGIIYEYGQYGQEIDLEEALKWYKMAAEKNHEGAADNVQRVLQAVFDTACNYKDGTNGYEKNEEEAVKYYKLVAEDESAKDSLEKDAYYYLGWIMSKNETEEDDAESVFWYEKAIEKGVISAINSLGWNYGNGIGVTQDYEKAIELYRQAADSGNSMAMNNLGIIYEYGQYGQEIDLEEALKWYKMAAEKEHDGAEDSVQRVSKYILG